jgi:hypothetical protein
VSVVTYVFGIVVALAVLLSISEMLRRRRVRERHAVWWLAAGLVALVVAVFPGLLTGVSSALGFTVPTNLGFFLAIIVLFLVSVSQSSELTVLESKTRVLAEEVALLEERIVRLEQGGHGANPSAETHPAPAETHPAGAEAHPAPAGGAE